jgi:alkylated DNA repair dioxygenase AlkB
MFQPTLFPADFPRFAAGFYYEPDFLTEAEEADLIATVRELPLAAAEYKQFRARRRVVSYGGRFDYDSNTLNPTAPIPPFLHSLRDRVARWAGQPAESFVQALIAEYSKGTPLGWHRDVPQFERVIGVSLLNPCQMRFRRYPPGPREKSLSIDLAPRSIYRLEGDARWGWQHSVPAVDEPRYSITFRTLRTG